ncbi:nicotinate-nucleotide adenylyltransferase [Thiobacter aerophilum]|uniref:Probable nicotinate-nucleotide adenylyltransferase n=1 Tax=Thiobacter aerophilum TaxID=3121275 RepID=A0ABV0EE51_9BURK
MIGILGGTFDPIHYGHLRLAQEVAEGVALNAVRFIPTGKPWHRAPPHASGCHRLAMARLACAGNPLFWADAREVASQAPGYTVDTLSALRQELGQDLPLCLILGADAFLGLTSWHRWPLLFELAHIVVAQRPGFPSPDDQAGLPPALAAQWRARRVTDTAALRNTAAGHIYLQTITALNISATRIRADLAAGRSARYLLPDIVLDYIHRNRLYERSPQQ